MPKAGELGKVTAASPSTMPNPSTPNDALLGRTILGQYRIDQVLGQGGMGTVYQATQLSVGRPVALKLINADALGNDQIAKRFSREAQALSRLTHPSTVRLFDYGVTEQNQPFMVMELLQGRDLAAEIERHGAIPVRRALEIALQVLRALQEAHAQGVTHRDLKPSNIFLSHIEGSQVFAKVLDFGIAGIDQSESSKLTVTGIVMGSAAYMSPEQAQGHAVGPASDLYSLGAVLFEMLTAMPPFKAETMVSMLVAHITQPPPRLDIARPELPAPPAVQTLIDELMAKTPDARPPSAKAVADRIQSLLLAEELDQLPRGVAQAASDAPHQRMGSGPLGAVRNPTPGSGSASAVNTGSTGRGAFEGGNLSISGSVPGQRSHMPLYAGLGLVSLALAAGGAWRVFHTPTDSTHDEALARAGVVPVNAAVVEPSRALAVAAVPEVAALPVVAALPTGAAPQAAAAFTAKAAEPQSARPLAVAAARVNSQPSRALQAPSTVIQSSVPQSTPPVSIAPIRQAAAPVAQAPVASPAADPNLTSSNRGLRRLALLKAGPRYTNVPSAKAALASGALTRDGYEDAIWVLKALRDAGLRSAKSDYRARKIDKETYRARVDEIEGRYRGL